MSASAADSDAGLAQRALGGDDDAFAQLMSRHKHWALRFIRRYVGNAEDAYDVLQDTFFSAWLALTSYQRERPFESWLRMIALNKCRDRARRDRIRRVLFGNFEAAQAMPEPPDGAAGPEALAAARQEFSQLEQAVASLPRSLKEPLLLTTLEGLTHQQAGELLGLNAKAIEMRVYRARARLNLLMPARSSG